MCYSAQLLESFQDYIRVTGAEMDLDQFIEIFGARAAGERVRIPRGFERNFDRPGTAGERKVKSLIDQFRTAKVAELEQEIFAQRKRLAEAERRLASDRPTKKAGEDKRIATNKAEKALRDLPLYKTDKRTAMDGRIFPFSYAPIVVHEHGKNVVRLARYHLRRPNDPPSIDRERDGLYNARRDNLERYWRGQFGHTHALMLVTSFYENVERDGKNVVLHFEPKPADLMLVACLCAEWKGKDGSNLLSFAAITDEPPPEIAAAGHDRVIINLKPENVQHWLTPEGRSTEALQNILSDRQTPYYEHEVLAA